MNTIITDEGQKELFPANLADSPEYQKGVEEGRKAIADIFEEKEKTTDKRFYIYTEKNLRELPKDKGEYEIDLILKEITKFKQGDKERGDYKERNGYYEKLGLEKKYQKTIINMITELSQNTLKHGMEEYPGTISIYEKIENGEPFVCVETKNLIDINKEEDENKLNKFKQKLFNANNFTIEELKEQYMKQLQEGEFTGKSAGLGFRDMSRKSKEKDEDHPFDYEFEELPGKIVFARISCKLNLKQSIIADKIGVKQASSNISEAQITNTPAA